MINFLVLAAIFSTLLNYQNGQKYKVLGAVLLRTEYWLEINVKNNSERVYWKGKLLEQNPISSGAPERFGWEAGTPLGKFRISAKIATDPNGEYGPWFLALEKWENGQWTKSKIGLHGTNEPWLIGQDASHGCIRHYNETIRRLATLLPLGTQLEIVAD